MRTHSRSRNAATLSAVALGPPGPVLLSASAIANGALASDAVQLYVGNRIDLGAVYAVAEDFHAGVAPDSPPAGSSPSMVLSALMR